MAGVVFVTRRQQRFTFAFGQNFCGCPGYGLAAVCQKGMQIKLRKTGFTTILKWNLLLRLFHFAPFGGV